MIEKKVEVCIGTDRAGSVRVRLSLLLMDGDSVMSEKYHSMSLAPGDDPAAARAMVEAHITRKDGGVPGAPWPPIPDAEWAKVMTVIQVFHTEAAIERRRAAMAGLPAAIDP